MPRFKAWIDSSGFNGSAEASLGIIELLYAINEQYHIEKVSCFHRKRPDTEHQDP